MINWNDLRNFDFKNVDPTKIDLTRFDVRNVEMPKFEMPKFDMPKFDMPAAELPELPVDFGRVADFARDAAYAGLGVAVVAAHKLDEQRRQLSDQVNTQVRKFVATAA
jgi:hypothetical protein